MPLTPPKDAFDFLDDMFATLSSQEAQRAQIANSALSSGLAFYQKQDYKRATAELQRAVSLNPQNLDAYKFLANAYQAQKKPAEAIKVYKNMLALDPTQDSVHRSLGNIYLQQKKYDLAEKSFMEASKLYPNDTVAPYTLGQLYLQTNRLPEAEAKFKAVARMAPNDPNPFYSLGTTHNKQKRYKEAVKDLTQAIKLRPNMVAAHFELGVAYAALGDTANAQREVSILKKMDATQSALLKATIAQPKMVTAGGGPTDNFNSVLGMNSQLFALDVALLNPNTAQEFSMSFYFDSKMDPKSVQDISNWTITKASGGAAGYYNNLLPVLPTEAHIPQNPTRVVYDQEKQMATVTFLLTQNANADATIDPAHMVFKFSGTDLKGKTMDTSADEFSGSVLSVF